MSTTTYFGSAEAQAARSLIGGTAIGDTRNDLLKQILVAMANKASGPSGAAWGAITGTLGDQTDLANALAAKLDKTGGTMTGALVNSTNGAASTPALHLTGTLFTGGSATTTKPLALIEPTGTTSTGWSTAGTMLGVNGPSGFGGHYLRILKGGLPKLTIASGDFDVPTFTGDSTYGLIYFNSTAQFNSANVSVAGGQLELSNSGRSTGVSLRGDQSTGLMQIQNGPNNCRVELFGAYTDASNYRRLALASTTAGVFSITPEGAGTGASGNVLHISGLPTSNPGPGILWNNAGTPAIGT